MRETEMPVTAAAQMSPEVPMEIDVAAEMKSKILVENGLNGHFKLKEEDEKSKVVFGDANGKNMKIEIFATCEKIAAENAEKPIMSMYKESKNIVSKLKSINSDIEICASQIRAFLKTREVLFHTPTDALRTNPHFITLYGSTINEANKRAASLSYQNDSSQKTKNGPEGLEVLSVVRSKTNLPPAGEFKRKELVAGDRVYVMKQSQVGEFGIGTILSIREANPDKLYKIRLENTKSTSLKLFTAKQLSYMTPPDVIVPVGTRICARYTDGIRSAVFAGIIAEPPKITNNERYLIFFDDGYAQYISHQDIFVMCAQSKEVSDDVHENLKEFIKAYLHKYPERPMVKLQQNQITKTEYECKWWDTKVLDIDASMVKMYFIESHRTEWIYRGSTRLKLLFNELNHAEESRRSGKFRRHHLAPRKPHQPYVEYTREEEEIVTIESDSETEETASFQYRHARRKIGGSQNQKNDSDKPSRNTARKSTAPKRIGICNAPLKYHAPDIKSHLGFKEIHNMTAFNRLAYKPHVCSYLCKEKQDPSQLKGKNPLLIPIYFNWERQIRKYKKKRSSLRNKVIYRAPCGRHLRSLQEIQDYLMLTESHLTIDYFSVDPMLVVFRTFRAKEVLYEDKDVTQGKENVPVSCVNSWSEEPPPYVEYESQRFPGKNVNLNLDTNFLCGCSCTDNCQDPEKCECQQFTSYAKTGRIGEACGYKFRRLKGQIVTGVYECNVTCKCNPQCANRVVQNGLQVRLQMFKTERKGWGIRCLDDLDAGQFICIYAGRLITDQGADEYGHQYGDEYLAELDHIESAERSKEGYESDVSDIEADANEEEEEKSNAAKSDASDDDPNDPDATFTTDENDSDFEPNLRSTAITSLSTRRSKKVKLSDNSNSLVTVNGESEEEEGVKKIKKGLPDITTSLTDSITIIPCPLSPESAEFLDKIELTRTPKLSDNDGKTVAKKSINAKQMAAQMKISKKEVKYKSVRNYFDEDTCYIMDAKIKGNIGRYLNHSCSPNVFVQNVFTDTHDLRFPAIAFFANHFILAGTELTWDYHYEVGSVENKVMYCYCDSRNCRGRLL